MAWYFWRGKYQNAVHSGVTKAYHEKYLKEYLAAANINLLEYQVVSSKIKLASAQRLEFYSNLLALLQSGLPLKLSFGVLQKQARKKKYAFFLHALVTDLEFGLQELTTDEVFPPQEAIFFKIGLEHNLINFLTQLVQDITIKNQFQKKISKILLMPLLSFASLIFVFLFMVFYVIPEISDLTGVQPSFVGYFNNFTYFQLLIMIFATLILLCLLIRQIVVFIKILFFKELQILPGLRIFSCILQTGLTSTQAFFALTPLSEFKEWHLLFDLQKKGLTFSDSLIQLNWHKIMPELLAVVELSSYTGNLAESITQLVDYYNQKTINKLELIVTILQPFFLFLISLAVFGLISKVYLPIMDLNNLNL
jgi:type II secretory pathway component PulF